jgi:hypothetical protein
MSVTGQGQCFSPTAATGGVRTLDHPDGDAGAREDKGGSKTVRPSAYHDDIGT